MDEQTKYYENKLAFEMDPSDLFAALGSNQNIIAIDARQAQGYDTEHIPGAINIPHRLMTNASTQHLDKEALYVIYCDGIGCNASTKGALNMAKLGFNVRELIGGIEWWKFDGYATAGSSAAVGGLQVSCPC